MRSALRTAEVPPDSGFYQLVDRLRETRDIRLGRLGRFHFPAGYYVYTGSARRNLQARIARHLRRRKKARWHIDYLLRFGRVVEIRLYGRDQSECGLNKKVESLPGGKVIAPGFGSSDCGCSTHLLYFERNPVQDMEELLPSRLGRTPARGKVRT